MNIHSADDHKGSILIVDDSPDNLRVLSASLSVLGYKVRCVTNGEMALVSLKSCHPDLILLDVLMPALDGYEVCRRIKSDPDIQNIPIIFLSALGDALDKVKAFEVGAADYVTKPFQTEEILARITHQLTIQRLQNQLTEHNQQLHQEIEAHKRTEAALRDAKEAAEIANRAKSNFIARMSHELRTPLNTVLGFSGLMAHDSLLTEEHRTYLSSIQSAAQNILGMINQVLSITKKESTQILLNQKNIDLYSLLDKIVSNYCDAAQIKGLSLNLYIGSDVPRNVYLDDGKLQQIIAQLLRNAIQFTHSGEVNLRVCLGEHNQQSCSLPGHCEHVDDSELTDQPNSKLLFFEVEDTGHGIETQEIGQLFQAFTASESRPQAEQGLGLGLYLSHQYIQALGGQISLSSPPSQGTLVRFCLPVQLSAAQALPQLPQPSAPAHLSANVELREGVSPKLPPMSQETVVVLMIEALGTELSVDWVIQLHTAAMQGFDQKITSLLQPVSTVDLPLARMLAKWNKSFQFDHIVAVTEQVLAQRQ